MNQVCDLHTHSHFSDGTFTPTQIVEAAVALGLSAVALCDHNTVDGLPEFLSAAQKKPIHAVAGAEFSVDYEGTELHLLGLYLPENSFDRISQLMATVQERKEESNFALVQSLNAAGYALDYETIKAASPTSKINRAHIARALTEAGYTESISQAFQDLLAPEQGHYREPERLTVWQMLTFLQEIGAVPVLAHPFLNLTEDALRNFLPEAKKAGLRGMECRYSLYKPHETALSMELAASFDLLPSGGSDFHGANKPHIALGSGTGDLAVPGRWAEALKP